MVWCRRCCIARWSLYLLQIGIQSCARRAVIGYFIPAAKTVADVVSDATPTTPEASGSTLPDNDNTPRASAAEKGKARADITLEDRRATSQPAQTGITTALAHSFNSLNNAVAEAAAATVHGVAGVTRTAASYLNQLNYFESADSIAQRRQDWIMGYQYDQSRANRNYYPFTTKDPFDSYWTQLMKLIVVEGSEERQIRTSLMQSAEARHNAQYNAMLGYTNQPHTPIASAVGIRSGAETPSVDAWAARAGRD